MPYAVMLVDNEPVIPRGLLRLIDWQSHGCEVRAVARDGADAIRQIEADPPDIVITDIRMPEVDGLQLCQWVREHHPRIRLILLTGFPDFEYAQQAIQYQVVDFVLKPTTEQALAAAVDKACGQLRKGEDTDGNLELEQRILLGELLFSHRHSTLYVLNKLHELHMSLNSYYVLSLKIQGSAENAAQQLRQAREFLDDSCCGCRHYYVPSGDDDCYVVLCPARGEGPSDICTQAAEAADRDSDFVLTVGISRRHNDPLQLRQAAREADDARQFASYSAQPSVIRCEDLPQLSEQTARELMEKLRLVESALENRSREATLKNLDDFFLFLSRTAMPYSSMHRAVQLLYSFCVGLLASHTAADGLQTGRYDLRGGTPEALEAEMRAFVQDTLDRISRTPGNIDSIVYGVKQYIDHNYSASLSLDQLAAQVHLSSSYLSKLFKREMGVNLSTYILNTRIERAKFLLRTTDKKAYEIAEAVGIYDPVYFSKIFKKVTGLKPKQYREQPDTDRKEN